MRKSWIVIAAIAIAVLFYSLGAAMASNPIKIFVDGKEIKSDVPAQLVNGRTMVPLRVVGEALGADVAWDGAKNAVIITSGGNQPGTASVATTTPTANKGLSKSNPIPLGELGATPDGFTVSVSSIIDGDRAWNIIRATNQFNDEPTTGYNYILVGVTITNNKSAQEPAYISGSDFALVGSSNVVFKSHDRSVVLPSEGASKELRGQLYHGGKLTGVICFHIPKDETNLVLTWDKPWDVKNKRYFEVK